MTAVALMRANVLAAWLPGLVRIASVAIPIASILLGWRFNRSRLVFAVLMLAIADRSLIYFTQGTAASTASGKLIYNAVAVLLPLNLVLMALVKERGFTTVRGVWRMCLILAQPLAIALLCHYHCFAVNAYLKYPLVEASLLKQFLATSLPQPALIAALVAFLVLGFGLATRNGAIEIGFFWALITVCFALVSGKTGLSSTFYFCLAGFILLISVVEASYVMAFRDELTGLPARRTLNEFLLKMGSRYTLAMLDIDFFKKLNDTYGHDVGDEVLRMVASKLSQVSGGGKVFRYGGEEFTVIFPGKAADEAIPHLEQLRVAVKAAGFVVRGRNRPRKRSVRANSARDSQKRVAVTISIGVAERNAQHASSQEVIRAADKALYRAKKGGRNRVST